MTGTSNQAYDGQPVSELEARNLMIQANRLAYGIMLAATQPTPFWKDIQERYAHLNELLASLVRSS